MKYNYEIYKLVNTLNETPKAPTKQKFYNSFHNIIVCLGTLLKFFIW